MKKITTLRYPLTANCKDGPVTVAMFVKENFSAMVAFANSLPEHDMLFLKRDLAQPKVLEAWVNAVENGDIVSMIASRDGEILGCTAIVTDKYSWSAHVGEVRALIAPKMKDQGLGRLLIQECFIVGLQLGLAKLTAEMTVDQEGAITVFEDMGFATEALLKDHVMDRSGNKHDILILSQDVEQFHARKDLYGLSQAF